MNAPHPAFLAAPADRRWDRPVSPELWATLNREARELQPRASFWILPTGTRIGLELMETGQRSVILYRREPLGDGNLAAWTAEVIHIIRTLGILGWRKEPTNLEGGGIACVLVEGARPEPEAKDETVARVSRRYFAMLKEAGLHRPPDRRAFQEKLRAAGRVVSSSCTDWGREDFLHAIEDLSAGGAS